MCCLHLTPHPPGGSAGTSLALQRGSGQGGRVPSSDTAEGVGMSASSESWAELSWRGSEIGPWWPSKVFGFLKLPVAREIRSRLSWECFSVLGGINAAWDESPSAQYRVCSASMCPEPATHTRTCPRTMPSWPPWSWCRPCEKSGLKTRQSQTLEN